MVQPVITGYLSLYESVLLCYILVTYKVVDYLPYLKLAGSADSRCT